MQSLTGFNHTRVRPKIKEEIDLNMKNLKTNNEFQKKITLAAFWPVPLLEKEFSITTGLSAPIPKLAC